MAAADIAAVAAAAADIAAAVVVVVVVADTEVAEEGTVIDRSTALPVYRLTTRRCR